MHPEHPGRDADEEEFIVYGHGAALGMFNRSASIAPTAGWRDD
jgi:hypothetical protein